MDNSEILKKVEAVILPTIENLGCSLVDCEHVFECGTSILRIYIDKQDGVKIRDCELVSRALGDVLDAEDLLRGRYNLEVSSPGLNRVLKTKNDFEKYCGKQVNIKTKEPINGRGNYKGTIESVGENDVTVMVDGQAYRLEIDMIAKARLVPEI